MKNNKQEEIWKSLQGVAGITEVLRNTAFLNPQKPKKSVDDIIEEEQDDDDNDFTAEYCKTCGKKMENLYSWYNLIHEYNRSKSDSVCSIKCLDAFREQYNADDYEIIEHYRCSAYFECEEIENLRGKCERIENKSYRDLSTFSMSNFCEPAQAGIILATHKLTGALKDFSKQTGEQYLSNKEMMEQGAKESAKQFKITTWMTILVIILTVINLVPTFLNIGGEDNSSEQLVNIETQLSELDASNDLTQVENKIDEIAGLISNGSSNDNEIIINLLESIQNELKILNGQ